ncbi:MAG: hypothetical protein IT317_08835 [Anaerolineales bacterium]|nr:hypothetical protein [Anaerolineales bacterium]
MQRWLWGAALLALLVSLGAHATPAVYATGAPTFTVVVASAYLRDSPVAGAPPTFSVFQNQTYRITGRTSDRTWVALDAAGASGGTWIRASYGTVSGDLSAVPVTGVAGAGAGGGSAAGAATPAATAPAASGTGGTAGVRLKFTLTAKSSYVRAAPNYSSTRLASLFRGEAMTAISRDAFGNWVRVEYGGGTGLGWLPLGVGTLGGEVLSLPLDGPGVATVVSSPANSAVTVPVVAAGATPNAPFPAWVPTINAHMAGIYHAAAANGRDPNMFALVGDCNSEEWLFQGVVAVGSWDYVNHPYLAETVRQFANAWNRNSVAVSGGFNSTSVLDPGLATPTQCTWGESPLACELRVTRASILIVELGTGDHYFYDRVESNYRRIIEYALSIGVLPILRTKADRLETEERGAPPNYINDVIRRLGQEYDVPVLDFDLATSTMPNHGLTDEPGNDFHVSAQALGEHVLSFLQTLYAITHAP